MERSFREEVEKPGLGEGNTFHGEGILAVTKALLQLGVTYASSVPGVRPATARSVVQFMAAPFAYTREIVAPTARFFLEVAGSPARCSRWCALYRDAPAPTHNRGFE